MRKFLLSLSLLIAVGACAAPLLPYDDAADAKAAVTQALASVQADQRPVLLIFGANWCEDCRALDQALKRDKNAALIASKFKVVKISVGQFDHNLELAAEYGNPIKKGIPAAVVVSPDNKVLFSTKGGELADARRMSETGIYDFFERVTVAAEAAQAEATR
jgi:thioredoxin 1